jgi:hypothetical protein
MNVDDAARTIADYVLGGAATREQLEQACQAVNSHSACRAFFVREFGLDGPPETACRQFDAHMAELIEMSRVQRERELPELVRHAEHCPRCLHSFWQVRGEPWSPPLSGTGGAAAAAAAPGPGAAVAAVTAAITTGAESAIQAVREGVQLVRRLAEDIWVAVGSAGQLVEYGLGLRSHELEFITVGGMRLGREAREPVMGTVADPSGAEREWLLKDNVFKGDDPAAGEYEVKIQIRARGSAQGKVQLWCQVDGLPESSAEGMNLVVSGLKHRTGTGVERVPYYFEDRLVARKKDGVEVPEGEYTVKIEPGQQPKGGPRLPVWEIPLNLGGRGE